MTRLRFFERFREHSWIGVLIDLFIVVMGILLALRLDGWAQMKEEVRIEALYLERLVVDLQIERNQMDAAEMYATDRIEAALYLETLANNPGMIPEQPERLPWALETVSWRSFPRINAFVYRELQSTGRLAMLRSVSIRRKLAQHYAAVQHDAQVGEDLAAQHRYDAAIAGILSIDELTAVELSAGDYDQLSITSERAVELAKSLVNVPEALAELPSLVQHHTFNLRVIDQMRERGDEIIELIQKENGVSEIEEKY